MGHKVEIRSGMRTRSVDGEKLGKIVALDDWGFTVEKGLFRKKDRLAHYEDILEVNGDEVLLGVKASEFEHGDGGRARGETGGTERRPERRHEAPRERELRERERRPERSEAAGAREEALRERERRRERSEAARSREEMPRERERRPERSEAAGAREETRVPLAEEEIEVSKERRPVGEVHLRKEVVSEQKQVEVPVMREQVRVERVPAGSETAGARESAFREDEISIPVMEEEIEVRKRPVVKEEIRVTKEAYQEQRSATADARREEIHVEGRGGVRRTDDDDPNKRR